MANEITLEQALAKIKSLEAENTSLTSTVNSLKEEITSVQETSLATIAELQEKLKDTEAQKAGGLPIRKITKGENAGRYQFTAASFKFKGEVVKASAVKNDGELLQTLVKIKSGIIVKVEESKA